jgi:hypothetical protein
MIDRDAPFSYSRWHAVLPELRERYRAAQPFPHVQLSDFFDSPVIDGVTEEFTETVSGPWVQYKHYNENKSGLTRRSALPPLIGRVVDELNSAAFVAWLCDLTGIPDLVADPTLEGGGLHQTGAGGFLNIHADFTSHHHQPNWQRRVNVIVYLNREWRQEWGGAIELWDRHVQHAVVRVRPLLNHAVIFNTDERSYHGYPDPLRCPPDATRKSLALYYYTVDTDARAVGRSTNYRPRPGDGLRKSAFIWADRRLVDVYSRLKARLGLSDDLASRALGFLDRWQRRRDREDVRR